MKKRTITALLTTMITLFTTVFVYAAENEYAISAIDLIVNVSDELNVLTRNVSEGHPALQILEGANAVDLRNSFIQNNIYLNAFPDDLKYEIIITATNVNNDSAKNFSELENNEFEAYCKQLTESFESSEHEELLDISIYENDTTKYVVTHTHNTNNNISVYAKRYYTVMNGFNYNYILQTDDIEITSELEENFLEIINSANYTKVDASITESGIFMEMYETFIGFGLTVLILGTILFLSTRPTKKHS